MAKNTQYWNNRYLDIKKAQLSKAKKYEQAYAKNMASTFKAIEAEIDAWCKRYAEEDGTIDPLQAKKLLRGSDLQNWKYTLSEWEQMAKDGNYEHELDLEYYKSRVSRLQELEGQISKMMAKATTDEIPALESLLKDGYKDTYYRTIYTRQMQTGAITGNFAYISENKLNAIVRAGWKGSNFSERIWGNATSKLPRTLTESLYRGIALGYKQDDLMRLAKGKLKDFKDDDIHRLVVTESAYITEQATYSAYEASGIEKYEWIAALESSTCKVDYVINGKTYHGCAGLDGEVFEVGPKNFLPPLHPYCRCTTAPWDEILDQMNFTRWSRDPVTGRSVDTEAATYDEWQEMVGLKREDKKPAAKAKEPWLRAAEAIVKDAQLNKRSQELQQAKQASSDHYAKLIELNKQRTELRYKIESAESRYRLDGDPKDLEEAERMKKERTQAAHDYDKLYFQYMRLKKEVDEISLNYVKDNADRVKEILSEYRQFGVGSVDLKGHIANPRAQMSKVLAEAYEYFPTDWVKRSADYAPIRTKKVKRGYYIHNQFESELALSGRDGEHNTLRTAIHELGHRQEHISADILKAEKDFYDRRTKGESLERLKDIEKNSGYGPAERTRKDDFLDAYMGKDYGETAYELLSMGTDTLFGDPLEMAKDADMMNWLLETILTK
ncbi:minor capsid protein [Enterococcus olivae]